VWLRIHLFQLCQRRISVTNAIAVAGGSRPYLSAPKCQQMGAQLLSYLHNFCYNVNFGQLSQIIFRWKMRPNCCRWRHYYNWQPIKSYQRLIQQYHRRSFTTYGLATLHTLQKTDRRQIVRQARPLVIRLTIIVSKSSFIGR